MPFKLISSLNIYDPHSETEVVFHTPLPMDMWSAIFRWIPLPQRASLAEVSRDWCRLVREDPTLWANGEVACIGALHAVRRYSGNLLWDIHLIPKSCFDRLWLSIKPDTSRLQGLHICVPGGATDLALLDDLLQWSFPVLTKLGISHDEQASLDGPPVVVLPRHFGSTLAPQVIDVDLRAILILPDNFQPWKSVRVFSVGLHGAVSRRRLLEILPNARSITVTGGSGFPDGPVPPSLVHLNLGVSAIDPWGQDRNVAVGTSWGRYSNLRQVVIEVDDGAPKSVTLQSVFQLFTEAICPARSFTLACGLTLGVSASIRVPPNASPAFIVGANFRQTAFGWLDSLTRSDQLTHLQIDRMAFCRFAQRGIQLPAVIELVLQFCVPSLDPGVWGFERAFSLLDCSKVLSVAGRPRAVELPSLRRVLVTRPQCDHDHSMDEAHVDENQQTATNQTYGFSNSLEDRDRETTFFTKFAPLCLQRHIGTTSGVIAEVCVHISKVAAMRTEERGCSLNALYGNLAQVGHVQVVFDDAARNE